jgi:V8-like Glu-specific endopeptidase
MSLAAAATLAVATAQAATTPTGATQAVESKDVGTSSPSLTQEAREAGLKAAGARASNAQALQAYWTPARLKAAIPADKDAGVQRSATAYVDAQQENQRKGVKPTTNDGPLRKVDGSTSKAFAGGSPGKNPMAYNPNLPYYVPTAYTAGKVFFTKGGAGYACSGTIVNSEGKDTVWTAGHCVHGGSGGTWHSDWVFVPAYDDDLANPAPYGVWSANHLWTKGGWASSSDFSLDMGVAIMNPNWGWHIVDYFGGQGLTTNRGKYVWENAFGYPGEWPFDGGNLMRCWGSTSPEWDAWLFWSQTVKIPCDMTRGSSGGGWLYGYDGNWGWLNGVNSRIDRIVGPTIMLSPYFDDDAWGLYNSTRYL